jgi:hypothetical protein
MAVDREFRIKIVTESSAAVAGARDVSSELKKVGAAAEKTGSDLELSGDKGGKGMGQVKKALGELAREFPIVGALARGLFNPIGLAVSVAVLSFGSLKKAIEEAGEELATTDWAKYSDETLKALGAGKTAAGEFKAEMDAIKVSVGAAADASERLMVVYKARQKAEDSLDEARKKFELTRAGGIKDPVARARTELEIEERYAGKKRKRQDEEAKFEIEQQQRNLAIAKDNEQMLENRLKAAKAQVGVNEKNTALIGEESKRLKTVDADYLAAAEKRDAALQGLENIPDKGNSGPARRRAQEKVDKWTTQLEVLGRMRSGIQKRIGGLQGQIQPVDPNYVPMLEEMLGGARSKRGGIEGMLPTQIATAGIEANTRGQVGAIESGTRLVEAGNDNSKFYADLLKELQAQRASGQGLQQTILKELQSRRAWEQEMDKKYEALARRSVPGV